MSLRSIRATLAESEIHLSDAAKLGKSRVDLFLARKAAGVGVAQATIDAGEFGRRRLVLAFGEALVDVSRDLGQLILRVGRPGFDAFEGLGQALGFHGIIIVVFGGVGKEPGACGKRSLYPRRGRRTKAKEATEMGRGNGYSLYFMTEKEE